MCCLILRLLDHYVWRHGEHDEGGHHREQGEEDKAQPVQHHRRELPVTLNLRGLVIIPHLVRDHSDLLENEAELSLERSGGESLLEAVWKIWI